MTWEVITRTLFDVWYEKQTDDVQEEIAAYFLILEETGPQLGRPHVDQVKASEYKNMKELRIQIGGHPFRAFFAFDPERKAIVLCAGDKKGEDEKLFYKRMTKIADAEFTSHLESPEIKHDGNA
ncbi:type II toxin-antitoxin system RelE/ParE family toxin [Pantoea sp. Bo_2]|uniref:Type II toxin-antitoxin system RelE/ParE family toxin n=1 Tax=Candidatus Pantoea gossypiicola TaxID=2608008 RepID=A0AB34CN41_9GAMM|nr:MULTISPECIES: type II toxin-antitoxin system RelE/ParE family toxin [Pantoea]KAA5931475.1 type II toxin-antitoxin system RelE/ParE family toxin [Pantoea sp. VH_8]KAA5936610.1 type II toxin-antitoxin system RelE/ParE family toxin [Pantoea sp. VH_4]KAA5948211.1 type II toxin-antitoxin system RelE/ParE family toxin [Pantoea sp. VH_3]KAA5950483.1 type II toxin-antitoxin system RelE/ParE family toxin [Pantoea sp. VH_24]KAA5953481.1 type II toxin-antitoxin system RelE/ParE family toxin [Pantoea s